MLLGETEDKAGDKEEIWVKCKVCGISLGLPLKYLGTVVSTFFGLTGRRFYCCIISGFEWLCLFSYFDPHLVGLLLDILSFIAVSFSGISIKFSVSY